ncbi:MAG: FAD-binding oxidoreductase [Candidatus Caldarchaeum sp.]|nr:FAD-binding oxidoreductase [Candidatus Caldarchaeum sp.]MDW8434965.1 FAD-dependent oxidoreductase [Candidatus Caldarchaeum sp.]
MRFDVVVVGGGSTGTSIAYYLSANGAGRVALLERNWVGWGQTGRSTAVVRLHYSTPEITKMALESWRVLKDMEKLVGGPSGFTAVGFMMFVGPEDYDGLRKNVDMQRSVGVNSRILQPDEVRQILPYVSSTGMAAAAYEPESGYADPVATAQTFSSAAVTNGAKLFEKCEVKSVKADGRRVERLETSSGYFEADVVVNATGVWCNDFLAMLGAEVPVAIMKEEIVVWKRPENLRGLHPVVGDLPNNFYMRPFADHHTYMGSINPDTENPGKTPSAFNLEEKVGIDTAGRYGDAVSNRFPDFAKAEFAGGWVGLYDVTPDWLPVVGFSRHYENLFNAVGMSGHGFKLAPAIGMHSSNIILGKKQHIIEPSFLDEKRFVEKKLAEKTYRYGVIS